MIFNKKKYLQNVLINVSVFSRNIDLHVLLTLNVVLGKTFDFNIFGNANVSIRGEGTLDLSSTLWHWTTPAW